MQHIMVIVCASRKLNTHEKNYPTHNLELVSVVFALKILEALSLWGTR